MVVLSVGIRLLGSDARGTVGEFLDIGAFGPRLFNDSGNWICRVC